MIRKVDLQIYVIFQLIYVTVFLEDEDASLLREAFADVIQADKELRRKEKHTKFSSSIYFPFFHFFLNKKKTSYIINH